MEDTASGGWGVAAAAVGGAFIAAPFIARPSAFLVLGALVFLVLLPFTTGAYRVARGRVGIEPTPLLARLTGRGALPPRAAIIPGVAVGVAALALLYNLLVSPIFGLLFRGAAPKASPVFLSGPEFLVLNTITVTEEIAFRLGALFLLAALFGARVAPGERTLSKRAWAAIVVSGLLFGLLHVVNAGYYGFPFGPFVLFSLVSQGVSGIFFGYVGWRFGVESSWLTHIAFNLFAFHLARLALGG